MKRKILSMARGVLFSLLWIFSFSALAQNITVQGTVTDKAGDLLIGVTVKVQGTAIGTITDGDGHFILPNVPPNATLEVSYVGMLSEIIPVNKRTSINVTMEEDSEILEEVVVIGYGTQMKRDITGAIASVNEHIISEKQPISVFDALQGAAAGVQIVSDTGAPGEGGNIRVRGAATMSDDGASPLYIVDGVQMDNIDAINPNDISSIEILKDAASASIYGSRSANGVVLISTKQGAVGKAKSEFKYLNSYSALSHKIPQANRLEREILERYNAIGLYPAANDSTIFSKNADNYYIDEISQTAVRHQFDFGISGGTPQLLYRGNIQYLDDEGIVIETYYKRLTGRLNISYKASERLTLNSNVNFWRTEKTNVNEGGVFLQAFQRPPHYAIYFPDGSYAYNIGGRLNPVADAKLRKNESEQYRGLFYQSADYKITNWLNIHGDIAATVTNDDLYYFVPKALVTTNINNGYNRVNFTVYTQGNAYASLQKTFNDAHNVSAMVGSSFEKSNIKTLRIQGTEFITESVSSLNAIGVLDPKNTYTTGTANALVGFFSRLGYNYKGRYLLNATIRADGSSRFGASNRWGYFPSVSVGWRFTDEPFMKWSTNVLKDGKLRVNTGKTGNQAIGNYDAQTEFVFGSYSYNGVHGVRTSSTMGNSQLRWEDTEQYNAGIDLTFLKDRFILIGDYYVKNTNNLLYSAALPYESGYNTVRTNLGSIQNKGIELSLTWRVVRNRNFSWTTMLNWSTNKNKITSLPEGNRADDIWWIGEGYEAGVFYGWKQLGVYAYDESNAWTPDFKTRLTPIFERDEYGNVKLNKANQPTLLGYQTPDGKNYTGEIKKQSSSGSVLGGGDLIWQELPGENGEINGEVGNEDRQILGKGHPTWFSGWNNQISYKNFSLSFSFYASFGNVVYNEAVRSRTTYATTGATPRPHEIYNFWKYPGQITDSYRRFNFDGNTRRGGDLFLEDASFIRLQSIRLTYRINKDIVNKLFLDNVNVFVAGNNLLTWTNYSGFDPEVSQTSILKPGNDNGRYPRNRVLSLGVNISF